MRGGIISRPSNSKLTLDIQDTDKEELSQVYNQFGWKNSSNLAKVFFKEGLVCIQNKKGGY